MMQDPIADMLTRIRNAQSANKLKVCMPISKKKMAIASLLKEEGYIQSFKLLSNTINRLEIVLKYFQGKPVIESIQRISKPSLRVYRNKRNLPIIMSGLGTAIISTSCGFMSDKQARHKGIGGEVICYII